MKKTLFWLFMFCLGCAAQQAPGELPTEPEVPAPVADSVRVVSHAGDSLNVESVAFSPDGRLALSGGTDGVVKLWDVARGKEIRTLGSHAGPVLALVFSPDGSIALSGGQDHTAKVWDVSSGDELHTLTGHAAAVHALAMSPYGRYAVSASADGSLKLWHLASGKEVYSFRGHTCDVYAVAFSPDGGTLLSGGWDGVLKLWDVSTGEEIRSIEGHQAAVRSVTFSPDGNLALSGSDDHSVKLWNVATGQEVRSFLGHTDAVRLVVFSPDGRHALTASDDRTVKLWDVSTGDEIRTYRGHTESVKSAAFSPDGRLALMASGDQMELGDVATGGGIRTFGTQIKAVRSVGFSRDGRLLLAGRSDGSVNLWDVTEGRKIAVLRGHAGAVESVAFAPSGKVALTGSSYGFLKFWDVDRARCVRTLEAHTDAVEAVAFSPNGRQALSGSTDGVVKLWDVTTGEELRAFTGHETGVRSVAFTQDGSQAISGNWDEIKLWNLATGREVRTSKVHTGRVEAVAFSPNGRQALSVDGDKIRLWDVPSGRELHALTGHADLVESVAFSPDARLALSGSRDGTLRIWDISTGAMIIEMLSAPDRKWIAHTPDGYYQSSPEGDSLVHVSFSGHQGQELAPIGQFASLCRRPDILRARLAGDLKAGTPAPELPYPPRVEMDAPLDQKEVSAGTYPLNIRVSSPGRVAHVQVLANGRSALEIPVDSHDKQISVEVPLLAGPNRITVLAFDSQGVSSNPQYANVNRTRAEGTRPALHLVAVGIGAYPALPEEWQMPQPSRDAESLAEAFHKGEGALFDPVQTDLLLEERATPSSITTTLERLSTMPAEDLVVLFLSGHLIRNQKGAPCLLTAASNLTGPEDTCLPLATLQTLLAAIPGRTILLLDVCHSWRTDSSLSLNSDELAEELFSRGSADAMVFLAAGSRQESYNQSVGDALYSVFGRGLTEGLTTRSREADLNEDGLVAFMELVDFVQGFANGATKGNQTPWLPHQALFADPPVAAVQVQ